MRGQRTVPPAAAPLSLVDLLHGVAAMAWSRRYLRGVESELRRYFGVRHVFLVSSGKAALYLILRALKTLDSRRQVIIPAYTCYSLPSSIVKAGLKIRLCDVDPETFDFDHDLLRRTVDAETLCVIPNHLFGIPSDIERIVDFCKDLGVFVVEDAAQAMGGRYNGRLLGTIGDIGFFSLGRGKNITCGSGGIVVTNDGRIAQVIEAQYLALKRPALLEAVGELLRVAVMAVCIHPALYRIPANKPFLEIGKTIYCKDFPVKQLSGMKAGLLWRWRQRLESSNKLRVESGAYFGEQLRQKVGTGFAVPYLRLPFLAESREERDRIHESLQRFGVSLMYPTALDRIQEIKGELEGSRYPAATMVAERLLTIPTHPLLSKSDKAVISRELSRVSAHAAYSTRRM